MIEFAKYGGLALIALLGVYFRIWVPWRDRQDR